jgi:hypothetical protein
VITMWDAAVSSENVKTPEDLSKWLDGLPDSRRLRWTRLINNLRAQSIVTGQNWTALQAFNEARQQALMDMVWGTFKFYSGKHVGAPELEIERLMQQYITLAQTDQDAARALMQSHPELAAQFNATMDPVEKEQLDEGFRLFNQAKIAYQKKLEAADANGTLINDYKDLSAEFGAAIDRLTNPMYQGGENTVYNPVFAKYFGVRDPQEFIKSIGMLMPLIPPNSVWNAGRVKTSTQVAEYKKTLEPGFNGALAYYGLLPTDTSAMLYQQLQDEYVDQPINQFTGETQFQLVPYTAQNVAQYLARGGVTGPYRADSFLTLVRDRTFRQWIGKGIGGTGKPTQPFMGYLSDEQLDLIGWNRSPKVKAAWKQYALMDWALKKWRAEAERTEQGKTGQGVSSSSTLYKLTYKANMDPLVAQLEASVPGFRNEYEFSKLRLHERLIALGAGTGNDPESQGMAKFLAICTDYWNELDSTPNASNKKQPGVGPTAQAARPVWTKYIHEVSALAEENPTWWTFFRGTYGISKFGFTTKWKEGAPATMQLMWGPEDLPYNESDDLETAWYE